MYLTRAVEVAGHKARHWKWWQYAIVILVPLALAAAGAVLVYQAQQPHTIHAVVAASLDAQTVAIKAKPSQATDRLAVYGIVFTGISTLCTVVTTGVAVVGSKAKVAARRSR